MSNLYKSMLLHSITSFYKLIFYGFFYQQYFSVAFLEFLGSAHFKIPKNMEFFSDIDNTLLIYLHRIKLLDFVNKENRKCNSLMKKKQIKP